MVRINSSPGSILNDSQLKACALEILHMSGFPGGCAEKHLYSELLEV